MPFTAPPTHVEGVGGPRPEEPPPPQQLAVHRDRAHGHTDAVDVVEEVVVQVPVPRVDEDGVVLRAADPAVRADLVLERVDPARRVHRGEEHEVAAVGEPAEPGQVRGGTARVAGERVLALEDAAGEVAHALGPSRAP